VSGEILSTSALSDILDLNVENSEEYDAQAYQLYECWIARSGNYEQVEYGMQRKQEQRLNV
jgi:hypothetical protein